MDSSALLAAWERGAERTPIARGLALLAIAWPERSFDEWAQAGVGERDEHLIRLRELLFGNRLEGMADCPQCGESLELAFATGDIRMPSRIDAARENAIRVEAGAYRLACRVPNSLDLLESTEMSVESRRAALVRRCVVSASMDGDSVDVGALPEAVVAAVAERLADADPQSAVELALTCPECRHNWLMPFDIVSYLWSEIDDWARRLVLDIHTLASSYGWSERDILAMTPRRRRMYIELLGA